MTTLAQAILELSKIVQHTPEGTATGGSTTTLLDSARREAVDFFDGGTIWFISGLLAGKSAVVQEWSPGTFTFATQTAVVAAGNLYAAAPSDYPKWLLVQSINRALGELRPLSQNTALVTVQDQERYTLPAGVYNVKQVEIAEELTDPFGFTPHYNWREFGGKLIFDPDHAPDTDGLVIYLHYQPYTTDLTADTDAIDNIIPLLALAWKAAVHCLRNRLQRVGADEQTLRDRLNEGIVEAERKAGQWKMPQAPARDPHLAAW